ncbi:SRPBCC family protein [Nocardioides sp. URHA0032]|uniref:SRPBCC family protein n=1 Tax=Nocardioides sp. URHA0032 TaxID=1380388 RepID=UPI00048B7094|nr:SRPBCC family protein [Nocardioides sp. URHA0032]
MRASFTFSGTWEIPAPVAAVHALLIDLERYPDWWPQVVAVASLGPNDARVLCRSALPYTLDLVLHAVDRSPDRLEVAVSGDLEGSVRFVLTATPGGTGLDLSQDVAVTGLLALGSYAARPLLRWNHQRMMAGCVAGLRRQLSIVDMSP